MNKKKEEENKERSAVDEFLDFGPAMEKDWRELSDEELKGFLGSWWRIRNNVSSKQKLY